MKSQEQKIIEFDQIEIEYYKAKINALKAELELAYAMLRIAHDDSNERSKS
jgi:hypothetical protein